MARSVNETQFRTAICTRPFSEFERLLSFQPNSDLTPTFINERQRVQTSLFMLFSVSTGSRPATLLADDSFSSNDSRSASADDLPEVVMPS
jgi:hypothetical protein